MIFLAQNLTFLAEVVMNLSAINPYVRVAMQSILKPHHEIKRRIIFDYELIYLEWGSLIFTYADREYHCGQGDFLFIRPGIPHSFHCGEEEVSQPHIHFDLFYTADSSRVPVSFKDLCELSSLEKSYLREDFFSSYPPNPFIIFPDKKRFDELFYPIVTDAPDVSPLAKKALLMQLLDILIHENFPASLSLPPKDGYTVLHQLKDYIDAGQGITMTLNDLEKQFNYSKFYLEKRFKKLYGTSLITYRNQKRMELAQQLLKTESVSAVAYRTGYSSIYSFSRAFKQHYGYCPSELKK
ncbi:MAG: AraC family transcriptional regulator [Ruminococcaceae bacterium]|nr:AraC family transcriptional regulator [Oscillospiraceae bacterium]